MTAHASTGSGCCCMYSMCALVFFLKVSPERQNAAVMWSLSWDDVISKSLAVNCSAAIRIESDQSRRFYFRLLLHAISASSSALSLPKQSSHLVLRVPQSSTYFFPRLLPPTVPRTSRRSGMVTGWEKHFCHLSSWIAPSGGKFQAGNKAFKHTP